MHTHNELYVSRKRSRFPNKTSSNWKYNVSIFNSKDCQQKNIWCLKICYQDFCNTSLRPSSCPCPLLTKQQLLKYNVNIVKLQVQKHRTCNVKHYFTSELYYKTNVLKKKKRYFFNQAEECELSTNLTSIWYSLFQEKNKSQEVWYSAYFFFLFFKKSKFPTW